MSEKQPRSRRKTPAGQANDAEIRERQKTGLGAQFPVHTTETGEYPRQQGGPLGLDEAAAAASSKLEETMDENEVKGTAREYTGKAQKTYGAVKDRVTDKAEELTDRLDDMDAEGTWNNVLSVVQENPGASVGISLLAGAGLGALIAWLVQD